MKEQTVKGGDMDKTEQKHTALPWLISCNGSIRSKEVRDKGFDDNICSMPFSSIREMDQMPEAKANAEFIVKACNDFYIHEELMKQGSQKIDELIQQKNELVEALREITSEFEIMHPILHPNNETLTKAKQALEKAGA